MTHLPPRPWSLRLQFRIREALMLLVALLILAAAGGLIYYVINLVQQIQADHALWEDGIEAVEASFSGREKSNNFILNSYDLNATWVDLSGKRHSEKVEFDLLFGSISSDDPFVLRYDKNDPSKCVLNHQVEKGFARWSFVAGVAAFALLFLFLVKVLLRELLRNGSLVRSVGRDGVEAVLEVVQTLPVMTPNKKRVVRTIVDYRPLPRAAEARVALGDKPFREPKSYLRVPLGDVITMSDGSPLGRTAFTLKDSPLALDEAGQKIFALYEPARPHRPVFLGSDFYPFVLKPAELEAFRSSLRRSAS